MSNELATNPQSSPWSIISPEMMRELDVEKLERLFALQERYDAKESERQFNVALAKFQSEMPQVHKSTKGQNGHYAKYEDIAIIADPILHRCGFSRSFAQSETEDSVTLILNLRHVGGHSTQTPFTIPKDGPAKTRDGRDITNKAQAAAITNSYAARYLIVNALGIVCSGEDRDGYQPNQQQELVNEVELREIVALLEKFPDFEDKREAFLGWLKLDALDQIPASRYQEVIRGIRAKLKEAGIQ